MKHYVQVVSLVALSAMWLIGLVGCHNEPHGLDSDGVKKGLVPINLVIGFPGSEMRSLDNPYVGVYTPWDRHPIEEVDQSEEDHQYYGPKFPSVKLYFVNKDGEFVYPVSRTFRQSDPEYDLFMNIGYTNKGVRVMVDPSVAAIWCVNREDMPFDPKHALIGNDSFLNPYYPNIPRGSRWDEIYTYQTKDYLAALPFLGYLDVSSSDKFLLFGEEAGAKPLMMMWPKFFRIEVYGQITKPSPEFEDIYLSAVYINNFSTKFYNDGSSYNGLASNPPKYPDDYKVCKAEDYDLTTHEWRGFPEAMCTKLTREDYKMLIKDFKNLDPDWKKQKVIGHQLFADDHYYEPEAQYHVIFEFSYKYKGVQRDHRFVTIRRLLDRHDKPTNNRSWYRSIFRINLDDLSPLFRKGVELTDDRPEADRSATRSMRVSACPIEEAMKWEAARQASRS